MPDYVPRRRSGKHLHRVTQIARQPNKLVALDGEGVSDPDGRHRYTLLVARCANGDAHIARTATADGELSTLECLAAILTVPHDRVIVAFSIGYDVAMMMRDLPRREHMRLAHGKNAYYAGFKLRYFPRKILSISYGKETRTVYDVFGYFQKSFIATLEEWQIGTPEQRERIRAMKDRRGEFANVSPADVERYCIEECDLLCVLMHRLCTLFDAAALYPARFSGVGPLAAHKLQVENVKEYLARDEIIEPLAWHAYYGGRFDLAAVGHFKHVYEYDINSAYPHQLTSLPCLMHGTWREWGYYHSHYRIALWHITWDVPDDCRWPPFPWRTEQGNVYYPPTGSGWYWAAEIAAGIAVIEQAGGHWAIDHGYIYHQECTHRPFAWIADLYHQRSAAKAAGNPVEKVYKLVYNSVYGKLAQTAGTERLEDGTLKLPTWQSAVWAGLVTSGCRAQILAALLTGGEHVISIATDGIVSTAPLPLGNSPDLGGWKAEEHAELWLLQPGVYFYPDTDAAKTRGHSRRELIWPEMLAAWKSLRWYDNPADGWTAHAVRFVGLTLGLRTGIFADWYRRWRPVEILVRFAPSRRILGASKSVVKRSSRCALLPNPWQGHRESTAYKPKLQHADKDETEVLEKLIAEDQP